MTADRVESIAAVIIEAGASADFSRGAEAMREKAAQHHELIDAAWCHEPDCWRDTMARTGWLPRNGWRPIESVPGGTSERYWFWLVPKTAAEAPKRTDGAAIVSAATPHALICTKGGWASLMKATHWMPLPEPPK